MRISADPNDPGFANFKQGRPVKIYLNGDLVGHVITADDVTGEIVRMVTGPGGAYIKDPSGTQMMQEVLRGIVHIELPNSSLH